MKNKTKTYLLLAAVLGIWGTIGYKIINGMSPDDTIIQENDFDLSFNPKINDETKTFSIETLDRDPFLGTLSNNQKERTTTTVLKSTPESIDNSPLIIYNGLVKKLNSIDQVFIVSINGNQYLLKKGQTADSIKLIRGSEKEITIGYRNKSQTIKRQ
ncbi:hypothetical protein [Psychroserpens luteolus]|uniref:hypothetical protein n=1 Tax=Psychroserpens luteolus TaxID=2855840 RepID=UPI001E590E0B|nr:hypothetical protein [Psychroserpens luteolus]MCD2260794.1 hypothetical protein [Psychroserpens luteolus]